MIYFVHFNVKAEFSKRAKQDAQLSQRPRCREHYTFRQK